MDQYVHYIRDAIHAQFDDAMSARGFYVAVPELDHVQYRSDRVVVDMHIGMWPPEIGVILTPVDAPELACSLVQAVLEKRERQTGEHNYAIALHMSTEERVRDVLKMAFDWFFQDCEELLCGDLDAYRRIKKRGDAWAREYTDRMIFGATRRNAQCAWENKDYEAAIRFYRKLGAARTAMEEKKLTYALKRLKEQ